MFERRGCGHLGQLIFVGALGPKLTPTWEQIVESPVVGFSTWPAHFHIADGGLVQVGGVPVTGQPAAKIPLLVNAFVIIPIQHLHDDPLGTAFVFVFRVNQACGMVGIVKLNEVLAQMMRGTRKLVAQGLVLPRFKVSPSYFVFAHPNVGRKKIDVCIHVAHVQRQGIFASQLANGFNGFKTVNAFFKRGGPRHRDFLKLRVQ